ncbi:hypothetical protein L2D08_14325 [Domibacillus sp. PGB-M46]|uniref:hypothetical protein n=1 Tax=Domibacillus sp. PGB-M46 TaxID=2910255 RepID=UPI001F55F217|nr:hypothetical protein [Domibacillus sp. PGB-M46]MCI2255547.1 hypothetical protein [Domibacillus sp. PGB-M46]
MNRMILSIFCTFFFISGCSNSSEEAYASIIIIDGKEYVGQELLTDNTFTVKEKVGEVKKQLDIDTMPKENWSSNAYEEGSDVYSVNEKDNIFLIEEHDNKYQILAEEAKDKQLSNNQDDTSTINKDGYDDARKSAWDFVKEKSWDDWAEENWQSANVTKTIADNNYELLDSTYEGTKVLLVSFEDKENLVIGTPPILIDPNTNKVIGYMLVE